MLRELRVLGIGDLCAVRSLDIGAVELLFEGRAHIGQILLAQSVALGGLLAFFASALMRSILDFSMVYVSLLFVFYHYTTFSQQFHFTFPKKRV